MVTEYEISQIKTQEDKDKCFEKLEKTLHEMVSYYCIGGMVKYLDDISDAKIGFGYEAMWNALKNQARLLALINAKTVQTDNPKK